MKHTFGSAVLAAALACGAQAAQAAETISTNQDLSAVIALQGQPCGQVVSFVKQGDNDFLASCQDGNRYRVMVNDQGRVVVQKQ